jgi:hypothetical protein
MNPHRRKRSGSEGTKAAGKPGPTSSPGKEKTAAWPDEARGKHAKWPNVNKVKTRMHEEGL